VRFDRAQISMSELDEAVLRVVAGPQRRGHLLTPAERTRVAYHESGHAVIAAATGRIADLHRLSIMAREHSLGQSAFTRRMKERAVLTRSEVHDELVMVLGGVVAEELVLGEPSTGSKHDLVRATELAETMAGIYGMSEHVGKLSLLRSEDGGFLGERAIPAETVGDGTLDVLHAEVRRIVDDAERTAHAILGAHRSVLDSLAERLAVEETLHSAELAELLSDVAETPPAAAALAPAIDLDGQASYTPFS
jgi:cell division protease FtsH